MDIQFYHTLLSEIKTKIQKAQVKAIFAVNAEMIFLYWEIGKSIAIQQEQKGWSAKIIPKLSQDLKNEFPEIKGFSERNFKFMVQFHKEYSQLPIGKQPVSQLEVSQISLLGKIPWGHHILLMEKVKDTNIRIWYAEKCIENGWSRELLQTQIQKQLHLREGKRICYHTKPA